MQGANTVDGISAESVIVGRYQLVARLGGGAEGSVWRAIDLRSEGSTCAVKVQARSIAPEHARLLLSLDHPNLARTRGLDAKLASGNALIRPYAVACTTVPTTMRIAEFGRRLDAAIRRAGFAPLRLDLAQDAGFAAANIPLGIGLDRKTDQ